MVELDLNGKRINLSKDEVRWLIARGAAQAGVSSQRRDLALILTRALTPASERANVIVLRRFEVRTLEALLSERTSTAA
jgi:hypothetical protein